MRSIRWRITVMATGVVVLVLLFAAVVLVLLQRSALRAGMDDGLTDRLHDVVVAARRGALKARITPLSSEEFVQVVGPAGRVVAATPNLTGKPVINLTPPSDGRIDRADVTDPAVSQDQLRVLVRAVPDVGTVVVATGTDPITDSTRALVRSLALLVPVVAIVLGGMVWVLVGRSLRPVERIRREVAAIGGQDLTRRVPQPGTRDEIDRLATTMNAMLTRLEASTARQQQFVADASHELRTPLTRLRTQLEVELTDADPAERPALAEALVDVVEMQRLVSDLLHLAHADAGELATRTEPVDLDDIVLREARRLRHETTCPVDTSAVSGALVTGDPAQLTRAVRNLTDNAAQHGRTRVRLSLQELDGDAVLVVSDDGPGISADQAEAVFGRFRQLDGARSARGTGLGLAITREIVQRHGGQVFVARDGGTGATFELHLPLAR